MIISETSATCDANNDLDNQARVFSYCSGTILQYKNKR